MDPNHPVRILEGNYMKKDLPSFRVGDTVKVHYLIQEGNKERIQIFQGTVIRIKKGGVRGTFTVRRIVAGEGVERIFPLHSPRVKDVNVTRRGKVRRSRLYYLRDRVGKATKVKELVGARKGKGGKTAQAGPAQENEETTTKVEA
ncbi:MAG TPA: 50S ribosomal protein L19 [Planctomycetes bacterium]|nr:50S ribosomal protein L19 [Planctomycetota bacterium]